MWNTSQVNEHQEQLNVSMPINSWMWRDSSRWGMGQHMVPQDVAQHMGQQVEHFLYVMQYSERNGARDLKKQSVRQYGAIATRGALFVLEIKDAEQIWGICTSCGLLRCMCYVEHRWISSMCSHQNGLDEQWSYIGWQVSCHHEWSYVDRNASW